MSYSLTEITEACYKAEVKEMTITKVISFLPKKRSALENRSLHKLFKHISDELNEMGIQFLYKGLKGIEFEIPYTQNTVKEFIWRPIQIAMTGKESTRNITSSEEKQIFEVLERWFAEKGVQIVWPHSGEDYHKYLKGEYKSK